MRPRAVEHRLRDVHEPDVEARLREHLGDAVAHRARADDADDLIIGLDATLCDRRSVGSVSVDVTSNRERRTAHVGPRTSKVSSFHRERDAVAAAEAQRRDAARQVPLLQRVEQRRQHARAARADGVPERDGAAVDVHLALVDARARAATATACTENASFSSNEIDVRRDPSRPSAATRRTASTGVISTNFGGRPLVACADDARERRRGRATARGRPP